MAHADAFELVLLFPFSELNEERNFVLLCKYLIAYGNYLRFVSPFDLVRDWKR